jgi:protein-tyrosine phosphatase
LQRDLAIEVDSCGTISMHEGNRPDQRSIDVMRSAGVDIALQRSRPICAEDFLRFDHILVMDGSNLSDVLALLSDDNAGGQVARLLLGGGAGADGCDVPDPYYGGDDGFIAVRDLVRAGTERWLDRKGFTA